MTITFGEMGGSCHRVALHLQRVLQAALPLDTAARADAGAAAADHGVAHLSSTESGAFNNQPDQISAIVGSSGGTLLYFCEDGGNDVGVHARDNTGKFYTILDAFPHYQSETTGLSFSPDNRHMYVSLQGGSGRHPGVIFDIYRLDGHPFGGKTLDIKYHAS